jgi:hypothetical protein
MCEPKRAQQLHHLDLLGLGERLRIRETGNEAAECGGDKIGPRPLQQQLGDQYLVGIARLPPREVASMRPKPMPNPTSQPGSVLRPQPCIGRTVHDRQGTPRGTLSPHGSEADGDP